MNINYVISSIMPIRDQLFYGFKIINNKIQRIQTVQEIIGNNLKFKST